MMRSPIRLPLFLLPVVASLAAASCSQTQTLLPSRDFDRPTDMVFTCMGVFDGQPSGRPMDYCHAVGYYDPPADLTSGKRRTFAFVPDSNSGEVTVVDADTWKPFDLDPAIGGYNRLPVGTLPEQIAASDDGCRVITANRGSCDFTLIDPAALVFSSSAPDGSSPPVPSSVLQTVVPATGAGPLRSAPQEIRFLPQDTSMMLGTGNLCTAAQTFGGLPQPGSTPALTSWKALATFPTCDLIAVIDLPSGAIVDSAYVRAESDGSIRLDPAGTSPTCPSDCGGPQPADAGAPAGGAPGSLGPSSIAIVPPQATGYGIRAYVSLANAPHVVGVDVTVDAHLVLPATSIALTPDALGSNRIRLSVNPYQSATPYSYDKPTETFSRSVQTLGGFVGAKPDRQYLYVIARDASVRVVQVGQSGQSERECDTNIDPLNPPPGFSPADACIPVNPMDPLANHRPFVVGPGIRLGTVPIDIMAADIQIDAPPTNDPGLAATVREGTVSGTYAWIVASNGGVYLVNIDPTLRATSVIPAPSPPGTIALNVESCVTITPDAVYPNLPVSTCRAEAAPPPNTLHNRNVMTFTRALDSGSGPPRLDLPPPIPTSGPRIETIWTQGTDANATALTSDFIQTQVAFPDPTGVTPQSWSVVWQGVLASPRASGKVSAVQGDTLTVTLEDLGTNFCGAGVETQDLVTLTGCTADNQCGLGQKCLLGGGAAEAAGGLSITGICINPAAEGMLKSPCAALLSTLRRYEVVVPDGSKATNLTLRPHLDEVILARLQPPVSTGGSPGTDGGAEGGSGGADAGNGPVSPCVDPQDPTTNAFSEVDLQDGRGLRCLMRCKTPGATTECRAGRICIEIPEVPRPDNQFCADAPPSLNVDQCFQQVTSYMINAGRAFVVTGSRIGAPSTEIASASGACQPNMQLDPRIVSRISMDAPDCATLPPDHADLDSRCNPQFPTICPGWKTGDPIPRHMPDALLGIVTSAPTPANSACLFIAGSNDGDPSNQSPKHTVALFRNTQIAFMVTNFERAPSTALNLGFEVHGGFAPQAVVNLSTVEVGMPARILPGPVDTLTGEPGARIAPNATEVPYLFVVDQRSLGRSQGGGPTRGQILRIHPAGYQPPDSPLKNQPIFEDISLSNNLFPLH